uniref:Ig-like domain-containing protein n=1 Tax=Neolamprologus brichardi TaxID=32507 RepID=A0A3Q4G720_NEOBR
MLCLCWILDAFLTVHPSSTLFIRETVSFKCDMKEGKHTDWEYKIIKDGREILNSNTNKDLSIKIASTAQSGKYTCSADNKRYQKTKNSNTVSVTVKGKPRATLTPGSTIIHVGGSVTLNCSVRSSAGWKYEWFRRDQNTEDQMRTDDQQNRVIRVSQGGIYHCRGRRGNPFYYADKSDDVTIKITCEFSHLVCLNLLSHFLSNLNFILCFLLNPLFYYILCSSTNQTINHTINQDEARDSQHASPHQGQR